MTLRPAPFAALWGAPGAGRLPVTVLGTGDGSDDGGILLRVRLADGDEQEVLADQLYAVETPGVNAIVLDDYRAEPRPGAAGAGVLLGLTLDLALRRPRLGRAASR